jgi:hypothetical protein
LPVHNSNSPIIHTDSINAYYLYISDGGYCHAVCWCVWLCAWLSVRCLQTKPGCVHAVVPAATYFRGVRPRVLRSPRMVLPLFRDGGMVNMVMEGGFPQRLPRGECHFLLNKIARVLRMFPGQARRQLHRVAGPGNCGGIIYGSADTHRYGSLARLLNLGKARALVSFSWSTYSAGNWRFRTLFALAFGWPL